jgi:hypothetical protein
MKRIHRFVAATVLLALPMVSSAHGYYYYDSGRAIVGGALGGATGALIGSELGGPDAAIVGGALGALVGSTAFSGPYYYGRPYYYSGRPHYYGRDVHIYHYDYPRRHHHPHKHYGHKHRR